MLLKIKSFLFPLLCTALAIMLLLMSKEVGDGIRLGLTLCTTVVIPSLFPFMVLTSFICLSSVSKTIGKILSPVTARFFKLSPEMGTVVLMSFIGGYPAGAKIIAAMAEQKKVSPQTASRMLCFTVNAGPAFIIGAVGVGIFGSLEMGIVLFVSQVLSALIIGIIVSRKAKPESLANSGTSMNIPAAFTHSVVNSASAMFQICAFIVIFSALINLLKNTGIMLAVSTFLSNILPFEYLDSSFFSGIIAGFFEVTSGCIYAAGLNSDLAFALTSLIISFSGLSIIFQVASCFKDIPVNLKPFFYSRFAHAFLTASIAFPLYKRFVKTISAGYTTSPPIMVLTPNSVLLSLCMLSMCSIVLLSISVNGFSCRKQ